MRKEERLRKRVDRLEKERRQLLKDLVKPDDMIAGSVYFVYKRCGKKTCRCARGELHGPFMSLSIPEAGKRTLRHVRQGDEEWAASHAARYREYQKSLARLSKINRRVLDTLKELRNARLKTYS